MLGFFLNWFKYYPSSGSSAECIHKKNIYHSINNKYKKLLGEKFLFPWTQTINITFLIWVIITWLLSTTDSLWPFLSQPPLILNSVLSILSLSVHSLINKTKKSLLSMSLGEREKRTSYYLIVVILDCSLGVLGVCVWWCQNIWR